MSFLEKEKKQQQQQNNNNNNIYNFKLNVQFSSI